MCLQQEWIEYYSHDCQKSNHLARKGIMVEEGASGRGCGGEQIIFECPHSLNTA
jgi:hypothetical protein